MPPWQIGQVIWHRREGATWSTNPVVLEVGASQDFRGFFTIVNGDEPINAGHLTPQRNLNGGGWQNGPGRIVENVEPGFDINAPQIVIWTQTFGASLVGSVETRLKVDWDGGPYFSPITINVQVIPAPISTGVTPEGSVRGRQLAGEARSHESGCDVYAPERLTIATAEELEALSRGKEFQSSVRGAGSSSLTGAPTRAGVVLGASSSTNRKAATAGTVDGQPLAGTVRRDQ
jgi:hypothetical protein